VKTIRILVLLFIAAGAIALALLPLLIYLGKK